MAGAVVGGGRDWVVAAAIVAVGGVVAVGVALGIGDAVKVGTGVSTSPEGWNGVGVAAFGSRVARMNGANGRGVGDGTGAVQARRSAARTANDRMRQTVFVVRVL